ncbi:MBOAT family O-acyltransferase [Pseudobutyrivibrio sp.]|uniref:MBOAT family O-acyltransferase n=1 Tax=Pseudobutyrivibrio sp. TaxID=2014367 RepID=UPI001B70617A|nr:MBOAT family O-acyltransferase [Pseudobutyrivibrio sp.]MBP3261375.1 MBOAT family protein [Pseudobutyrivibrio sp.]
MNYTSFAFFVMLLVILIAYYIINKKYRWTVLLLGSAFFYIHIITSLKQAAIFLMSIIITYITGLLLQKTKILSDKKVRIVILWAGILFAGMPLFITKVGEFITGSIIHNDKVFWITPVGVSFYTLQMIAYIVDIYRDKIDAQKNILKFMLFATFFPQIIQGPIPRYKEISNELFEGNDYSFNNIIRGIQLIIWGFFLKMMIADKSGIIVNTIFDNYPVYQGTYIWVAAFLYSIQLYTDFLSCTTISQGVSEMFGIHLANNFVHPYLATSIKDFWRRWHISLSLWLRDYVYIPLGGSKHGNIKKWFNLIITFLISGLWHGGRWKYLVWGMVHASIQIIEDIAKILKIKIIKTQNNNIEKVVNRIKTFFVVMFAWIIFRAESLRMSISMIKSMLFVFNPWVLFDDSLLKLGLNWKEWAVLFVSIGVLIYISRLQENGIIIRNWILKQNVIVRWGIYLMAIWGIWIMGTYGYGFNSNEFIYGGF